MALVITAVDDADGTGATATIAGSAGGTVAIWGARWDGGLTAAEFSQVATRVGNGAVAVTLDVGYWWLYGLESTDLSPMIGVCATSGDEAPYYRVLVAVHEKLQALTFSGITSAQILLQKFPLNPKLALTGIYVTPTRETVRGIVNSRDDYGYGVQVSYFWASNRDNTSQMGRTLKWRDQIEKAFNAQPLPDIADFSYQLQIEPGPVFDSRSFAEQFDAGSVVLRIMSREVRGV